MKMGDIAEQASQGTSLFERDEKMRFQKGSTRKEDNMIVTARPIAQKSYGNPHFQASGRLHIPVFR
jgi:hypothetical protein